MISIILPTHNRESTILRAVKSVLSQTYKDIELIVVDDHSTDGTIAKLKEINDNRLRVITLEKNMGACYARNYGIRVSHGEYIAFQDSDDEWLPHKLSEELHYLENYNLDMVFCAFNRINNKRVVQIPQRKFQLPITKSEIVKEILFDNFISTQTILAKRNVFNTVNFDTSLPRFQDWDLAIQIANNFNIGFVSQPLVNVYVQEDSITSNPKKGIAALDIIHSKYHDIIDEDIDIKMSFLKKKCILKYKNKEPAVEEASRYLKYRFDYKLLVVLLMSIKASHSKRHEK